MRKIVAVFAVVLLLQSCNLFKKKEIRKVKEAAVVSIYVDKRLDVSKFKELDGLAAKLAKDANFQIDTITNLLRRKTIRDYSGQMPFPLADEGDILATDRYQLAELPAFNRFAPSTPAGYKGIPVSREDAALSMFNHLPERIKAIMIVGMDYKLRKAGKVMTFVSAHVESRVTIRVWNKEGTSLMKAERTAISGDTVRFPLGGVFEAREISPLCIDASTKAIEKMEAYLAKKL